MSQAAQTASAVKLEQVRDNDWCNFARRVEREQRARFGCSLPAYQIRVPIERSHIVAYNQGSVTVQTGWRDAMELVADTWRCQQTSQPVASAGT